MKKLKILLLITIVYQVSYSQKKVASYEDGSKIEYDLISTKVDDMNKFNIYLGGGYNDRCNWGGFSYYNPNLMFIRTNFGGGEYGFNGLFFIGSHTEKDKSLNLTLKSESAGYNTILKKVVKETVKRKSHIGIHGGYAFKDFNVFNDLTIGENSSVEGLKVHELVIGIGRISGFHAKWGIQGKKKPAIIRGTSQIGIFADALLYPVRSYKPTLTNSQQEIDDVSSTIGFRAYIEGRSSMVGTGDWGFFYQLGGGYSTIKKPYLIFAFGLYIGFRQFNNL